MKLKTEKLQQNRQPVYVLDINGRPIMPTFRYKHVRQLRKQGRAKVTSYDPFTIQMLYDVGTETQSLSLGIDTGTSHIGASVVKTNGKELFSAIFNTNTLDVKGKMESRASHRHTRKRFKRDKKKRRAKANGTAFEGVRNFTVYGAETETICKDIKSNLCRLNKKVDEGKLSNTAAHCLDNHKNTVNKLFKILPITTVNVEYALFDIHRLVNPNIKGKDYQKGELFNELNHKAYVLSRDNHTCILCNKRKKNERLEVHHVIYKSKGGADHFNNLVTLHKECHEKVHKNANVEKKLFNIIQKKKTLNDQVITRPSTILNSVMTRFVSFLEDKEIEVNLTFGFETKAKRYLFDIEKTHNNDAYLVALGEKTPSKERASVFEYTQFPRNNRVYIYATKQRRYSEIVNGKTKVVCYNKNKAMAQSSDSLAEYRKEKGKRAVSKLKVTKGMRTFVDQSNYQFFKGDLVFYNKKLHVVKGNTNSGAYVRLEGQKNTNFKPKDLRLVEKNKGFRRTNW